MYDECFGLNGYQVPEKSVFWMLGVVSVRFGRVTLTLVFAGLLVTFRFTMIKSKFKSLQAICAAMNVFYPLRLVITRLLARPSVIMNTGLPWAFIVGGIGRGSYGVSYISRTGYFFE